MSCTRRWTATRSEEHTSELQSPCNLVCRLLLEKKKQLHSRYPIRSQHDHPYPAPAHGLPLHYSRPICSSGLSSAGRPGAGSCTHPHVCCRTVSLALCATCVAAICYALDFEVNLTQSRTEYLMRACILRS